MQLKLLDGLAHTRERSDPSSLLLPLWLLVRRRTPDPEDQQQCLCCYLVISKEDHFFIDTFEISVYFELTRGLLSC